MTLGSRVQKPSLWQQRIVACAILLVSSCPVLATMSAIALAQTYTQGLPTVGNNGMPSTAAPSKMLMDATLFPDTDMCASIADACAKLGTTNYPKGATIDARGFSPTTAASAGKTCTRRISADLPLQVIEPLEPPKALQYGVYAGNPALSAGIGLGQEGSATSWRGRGS